MKIGILGTGEVGNLLGSRLIENGHQVMMGGREANNQKGLDFVRMLLTEHLQQHPALVKLFLMPPMAGLH